jgi:hypothetical protein
MALVTRLIRQPLQATARHSPIDCTFDVITDEQGVKYLQLDTYGSKGGWFPERKARVCDSRPASSNS